MLNAAYVQDHLQYVKNVKPEFGQAIANLVLEHAIHQLESTSAESVNVPLTFEVTAMQLLGCLEVKVNGVHIGHVGL